MKITQKQINDIAQELESGMLVYVNRENSETRSIFDWEDAVGDTEFWEEEQEKIESEWKDYVVLSKMESSESFKVMEEFVDEVEDERLREDLIKILSRRSPFANFKAEVESSSYRQKWFDFRQSKYEEYVKDQLELEGFEIE